MTRWAAGLPPGVAAQSVTPLEGIKNAVGQQGKVVFAKGANVTDEKDIVEFLNQYEPAVTVDPRTPHDDRRSGEDGEKFRCSGRRGG